VTQFPWRWLRWAAAAAVLAAVLCRTRTGPFIAGVRGLDLGVAIAKAYGVMVLVASLPGAVVMIATARRGPVAPMDQAVSAEPRLAEEGSRPWVTVRTPS
jgi:hypothetical protein